MPEVFAGFVIGYAIAILAAPLVAWSLVHSSGQSAFARRVAPAGTNIVALTGVVHFAAMILFTALGIVLGLALHGIEDRRPDGGLGSPNAVYTLLVVSLVAAIAIPALALPSLRRPVLVAALVIAVMFGWAMPWLSLWG